MAGAGEGGGAGAKNHNVQARKNSTYLSRCFLNKSITN